jgi:hypothetical protein
VKLTPTSGGRSEWRAAVTAVDLRSLRESAEAELASQASAALAAEAAKRGLTLVEGSLLIGDRSESVSAPAGTAVDVAAIVLSAQVVGRAAPNQAVLELARDEAEQRAAGSNLLLPNEDTVRVEQDSDGQLRIEFALQTYGASLRANLVGQLIFRTRSRAQEIIESLLP